MPDGTRARLDFRDDPYAWATEQAALLADWPEAASGIDVAGLRDFLQDSADDMSSKVESLMVNLMSHVMKAALTRKPQVIPHWLDECDTFQTDLHLAYRPSMARAIRLDRVWRAARAVVVKSFARHCEPDPTLPEDCPFAQATLVDPDLDIDALVTDMRRRFGT